MAKKTKKPKGVQTTLPNTGRVDGIPELDEAAADLRRTRAGRMEMQESEKEQQEELLELLKKHKLKAYVYLDEESGETFDVELDDKVKVTIRKRKSAAAEAN